MRTLVIENFGDESYSGVVVYLVDKNARSRIKSPRNARRADLCGVRSQGRVLLALYNETARDESVTRDE
jgi:hypothetical protein